MVQGIRVMDLGFGVQGVRNRVQSEGLLGFENQDSGCRV
jgi:hypothetical protein